MRRPHLKIGRARGPPATTPHHSPLPSPIPPHVRRSARRPRRRTCLSMRTVDGRAPAPRSSMTPWAAAGVPAAPADGCIGTSDACGRTWRGCRGPSGVATREQQLRRHCMGRLVGGAGAAAPAGAAATDSRRRSPCCGRWRPRPAPESAAATAGAITHPPPLATARRPLAAIRSQSPGRHQHRAKRLQ